jgi:GNAT superfamily N-acetyltransferase
MSQPEIRHATVDEILPLRSEVLRGGGPLERALLPGDREGLGVHWGAWVDGRLAACGSLYEVTDEEGHRSTQLRGMATAPDLRNAGIGGALLEAAIAEWEASPNPVGPLWCKYRPGFFGISKPLAVAGFLLCETILKRNNLGPKKQGTSRQKSIGIF